MIVVGAKGFAKEVLELLINANYNVGAISFYDDVNIDSHKLFNQFNILHSYEEVKDWFTKTNTEFILGVGNPFIRRNLNEKFKKLGGVSVTLISENATVGSYDTVIGNGTSICDGVRITNSVKIGNNCLINLNTTIGHDCNIGDFVEICPNASISGNCIIGKNSFIGTGAIINPGIEIGEGVIIGAGAVVTKNISSNCTAVGVPANVI